MSAQRLLLGVLLLVVPAVTSAQGPVELPPPLPFAPTPPTAAPAPMPMLPPLFYLRVNGPAGMKITVYRGGATGSTLEAPATLGLRPGYTYRLALSDVPGFPLQVFYPTIEVRGTLLLSPKMRHADFPAALNLRVDDFNRAQAGAFLKRVIVLERPDVAIPVASRPETLLEVPIPAPRDALIEAREHGQPLALMYLGQRQPSPEEMRWQGVPGTVLLPGDKVLGSPAVPPWVLWQWCPVYDPILGPEHPGNFMTIPDGGDSGAPVGHDAAGRLRGLDPSDTVAEYVDTRGRRRIVASNRVGLCVPRFIVLTSETILAGQVARVGPGRMQSLTGRGALIGEQALQKEVVMQRSEGLGQGLRLGGMATSEGVTVVGRSQHLLFRSSLLRTEAVDGACQRPEDEIDLPLLIIKWPDKCGALVGDVVTFTLRYTNRSSRAITEVVVTDSLAPRFEYVPNSAKSDREAVFTTQANEAGALVLRWEFPGALPPGESGRVTFQVRVR